MRRDEAIKAAHKYAASCDVELGSHLFDVQHPHTRVWTMPFEIENRPARCWLFVIADDGSLRQCVATRRPGRIPGIECLL
jgi:hypothetical protein